MPKINIQNNSLVDALANLDPYFKSDPVYARGILTGAMAALMSIQTEDGACTFDEATDLIKPHLPDNIMPEAIPLSWAPDFPSPAGRAAPHKWLACLSRKGAIPIIYVMAENEPAARAEIIRRLKSLPDQFEFDQWARNGAWVVKDE